MIKARRIGFLIFATLLFIVLVGLAAWQLQRLQWKNNLIEQSKNAVSAKPVTITDIEAGQEYGFNVNFLRARLNGYYRHDLERYVYRSNKSKPGYHIITPFIEDKGYIVLVDRGWVPQKQRLPKDRADSRKPEGKITITGVTRNHSTGFKLFLPEPDQKKNIWYWYDRESLAKSLPAGLGEMSDGQQAIYSALFFQLEPKGEPGAGDVPKILPVTIKLTNNHLQYAITWFALALILLVMTIYFLRSSKSKPEDEKPKHEIKKQ